MKDRNKPAKPIWTENMIIGDDAGSGLTKLEYAAIHIHAAKITNKNNIDPHWSLHEANRIFDELEKQND